MSEQKPRRWRWAILWTLGVLTLVGVAAYAGDRWRVAARMAAVEAELDAAEPGWRLTDVLASRPEPSDGAARVRAVWDALPIGWADHRRAAKWPAANEALDPAQRETLDDLLPEDAVRAARELGAVTGGRYGPARPLPAGATREELIREQLPGYEVARLLSLDAHRQALAGDADGALRSVRAGLGVSRSFRNEPTVFGQSFRSTTLEIALEGAELVLALGPASDAALAALQRELEAVDPGEGMAEALRVERAAAHDALQQIAAGEGLREHFGAARYEKLSPLGLYLNRDAARREAPDVVPLLTGFRDASLLPPREQAEAAWALEKRGRMAGWWVGPWYAAGAHSLLKGSREARARAVAFRVLIAAERHRMARGSFPGAIGDLVPAYLDRVPDDPLGTGPIRYTRWESGVAAAAGPDAQAPRSEFAPEPKVLGYRLWDADKRRVSP